MIFIIPFEFQDDGFLEWLNRYVVKCIVCKVNGSKLQYYNKVVSFLLGTNIDAASEYLTAVHHLSLCHIPSGIQIKVDSKVVKIIESGCLNIKGYPIISKIVNTIRNDIDSIYQYYLEDRGCL